MARRAKELQDRILARIRGISALGERVREDWADPQSNDLPYARVGVTETLDASERLELLATVHLWQRSETTELIDAVCRTLEEPPAIENISITSWEQVLVEMRPDTELSGYRVLVRFRAEGEVL